MFIGIMELAKGHRIAATKHFRAAVDTRVFRFAEREWSRMFLYKLAEDPTWPPWIPIRDEDEVKSTPENSALGGNNEQ